MTDKHESTAHTPGPWRWDKGVDDEPDRCYVTQAGDVEYLIAIIENGAPGDSLDTEVANARLIAAAPDLLQLVYQYRDDMRHGLSDESRARRLQAIDAALALAGPARTETR